MKHIAEPIKEIQNGYRPHVFPDTAAKPKPKKRQYELTPLDNFDYSHLQTPEQRKRLMNAVDGVRDWIATAAVNPGQSLILSGPYGTGKTTMAENAIGKFRQAVSVSDPTTLRQIDIAETILARMRDEGQRHHPTYAKTQEWLNNLQKPIETSVLLGRLFTATELMKLLEERAGKGLEQIFGRWKMIVIDDLGEEEIDYTNAETEKLKRVRRYGDFVDFCYKNGKHVIITTNVRLITVKRDGSNKPVPEPNQQFVDIIGGRAFDRLYQMAKGYMFDLAGLPTYRKEIAR